jgi:hypothetical protein
VTGVGISFVVYVTVSLSSKADYEKADKFIAMAGLLPMRKRKAIE